MKIDGITAWRSITQPISDRSLPDASAVFRHGDPPHRYSSAIPVWRDGHPPVLRHGHHAHRHLSPIPAWQSITKPISIRSLPDALAGLRHVAQPHRYSRGIHAWRDRHQSHVAPARDIHRAGSPCQQTPQRQISLRGEANWTSPSKRLCPTPTLKGISRLDRQDKRGSGSNRPDNNLSGSKLPTDNPPEKNKKEGDQPSLPTIGRPPDYL